MAVLKVSLGASDVTLETDQDIEIVGALISNLVVMLESFKGRVSHLYDIKIDRIDQVGIFSYTIKTSLPERIFRETWHFDQPVALIEIGNVTGRWSANELAADACIRDKIREIHQAVGMVGLRCRW